MRSPSFCAVAVSPLPLLPASLSAASLRCAAEMPLRSSAARPRCGAIAHAATQPPCLLHRCHGCCSLAHICTCRDQASPRTDGRSRDERTQTSAEGQRRAHVRCLCAAQAARGEMFKADPRRPRGPQYAGRRASSCFAAAHNATTIQTLRPLQPCGNGRGRKMDANDRWRGFACSASPAHSRMNSQITVWRWGPRCAAACADTPMRQPPHVPHTHRDSLDED